MARVPWVGDHIPDVLNSRGQHAQPLQAQAKACVRHGAETPEVAVPPIVFGIQVHLLGPPVQHVQPLLALGATNDLTDGWRQHIHGSHSLLVLVKAHVEGLNVFRVVIEDRGLAKHLLAEVALMLGAQVHAPLHRHREVCVGGLPLQDLDALCVGETSEWLSQEVLQTLHETRLDLFVEELQILVVVLHGVLHAILQVVLRTIHVVLEIGKGQLRLNHPELGQVPGGVRVLRPETGAKGVDIREGAAVGLHSKLAADGHVGGLGEEILCVVDLARGVLWKAVLLGICEQGGDLEHLARTLTVCGRDQRRVHVDKAAGPEELVRCLAQRRPHTRHATDEVRAGPQVRDGAQELVAVGLLGKRVVLGVHRAEELHLIALLHKQLHCLLAAGRLHQVARALDGGTGATPALEGSKALCLGVQDHLQVSAA
mmetsp:Transcript_60942/g.196362  ORF Transcript_60942/g.196362 Transcript_60942/m.196362 type:complete len:427 (-) Transcript_60942:147-1427(-)